MSEYVNPDYPVPGTSQFLRPQYTETADPGFYYMGGGINPFDQPMMNPMFSMPQPMGNNGMGDSRRFLPDVQPQMNTPQPSQQQMGLNAFVESRRQVTPQPAPVSPWAQMTPQPMAPAGQPFAPQFMDPMTMVPYGNYSDMAHGAMCPPINRKMMWGDNATPNMFYDMPNIDWNGVQKPQQPVPQNQMYAPQGMAHAQVFNTNANPYGTPSVFTDNRPSSWDERAKSIWK